MSESLVLVFDKFHYFIIIFLY